MLLDLLTEQTVQVVGGDNLDWQKAIKLAASPLVTNETIDDQYVDEMIELVQKEGPYINIGPQIALAHSRPDGHVRKVGLSLLKTNHAVSLLSADHPVKLWFVLSAVDNTSHLTLIQELMQVLTDSDTLNSLLEESTSEEIIQSISKVVSQ